MKAALEISILRMVYLTVVDQHKRVESGGGMRENLKKFQLYKGGLAVGLALLPLMMSVAAWADNYTLESVDFASNGEKTNIIFHTGSIVPVQKVLVSNNKLILDVDQINADDTVKTNFVQASNISHVIMQPLGDHKMRMIIRGENLGAPTIAFFNPTVGAFSTPNPSYNGPKLQEDTATTLQAVQEQGTQTAALNPATDQGMEQTAVNNQATMDVIPTDVIPMESMQPAPTAKTPVEALTAPLALPAANVAQPAGTKNPFFEFKLPRTWETYIPYGLLGLLLLGVLGFVGYRVLKLKRAEKPLEDWVANESADEKEMAVPAEKRGNFREMAAAYRNKREQQKASIPSKKPQADDMISLRSLKQMEIIDEPAAKPVKASQPVEQPELNPTKTLENLLTALQANQVHKAPPAAKAAAPKQAVNQYLKSQPPNKKSAAARDREYQETLQRELKRAQDIQNQVKKQVQTKQPLQPQRVNNAPVNRAPAAKKNAPVTRPGAVVGNQGPLPGNPEVLNFLRNVADLMEKDGKADIAKSIHKNLNAQTLT